MKNTLLFLLFFFSNHLAFGQISNSIEVKSLSQRQQTLITPSPKLNFSQQIQDLSLQKSVTNKKSILQNDHKQMPSVYAFKDLAFFCKIEVQLEKAVKMPVKFRLGSVDYVDYLEGKRDSY